MLTTRRADTAGLRSSAVVALCLLALACAPPAAARYDGGGLDDPEREHGSEAALASCRDVPELALAHIGSSRCGVALISGDEGLELRNLEAGDQARGDRVEDWGGALPENCSSLHCDFQLASTPAGFLILAAERGHSEDLPRSLWLGGPALDQEKSGTSPFVPLWSGDPLRVDSSDFGPAFELRPWICGKRLVLRLNVREPSADIADAPPELLEHVSDESGPSGVRACRPVDLFLP